MNRRVSWRSANFPKRFAVWRSRKSKEVHSRFEHSMGFKISGSWSRDSLQTKRALYLTKTPFQVKCKLHDNVSVKSKLKHPPPGNPPGIWIFGKFLFKFPPPEAEKLFKCPIIGPFQVIKCPHPRETFQWLLLCSESCVCKHGLIENNLTCHEARGGQVTGNHPPKRTNNKVDKFWCRIWYDQ